MWENAQIDSVTQQNTANAEETASASQQLAAQARALQELLAKFNLKQEARTAAHQPEFVETALPIPQPPAASRGAGPPDTPVIDLNDDAFGKY